MVFPTPFSSARHFFPPNSKTSFLNVYRFFLRFARQQESRLFFLHQGFLLSCTLYQLKNLVTIQIRFHNDHQENQDKRWNG